MEIRVEIFSFFNIKKDLNVKNNIFKSETGNKKKLFNLGVLITKTL